MKCSKCDYDFNFPSVNILNDNHDYISCCPKCREEVIVVNVNKSTLSYAIKRYELLKLIS